MSPCIRREAVSLDTECVTPEPQKVSLTPCFLLHGGRSKMHPFVFALNGLSQHTLTPRSLKSFLVWQACKSLRDLFPTSWSARPPVFWPPLAPPPGQCDIMDAMDQCDVLQDVQVAYISIGL